LPEAENWFESCRQCDLLNVGIVALLCHSWRHVADRLEQTAMAEPVDPFKGGELDRIQRAPWAAPADQLSLEQAMDGFSERVVVAVANATNRGFDARLNEALRNTELTQIERPFRCGGSGHCPEQGGGHAAPPPEHRGRSRHALSATPANRRTCGATTS
jgi:hypothetical protein